MAKSMAEVLPYLISGRCLNCSRYKSEEGCNGKIKSEGCLGFKEKEEKK